MQGNTPKKTARRQTGELVSNVCGLRIGQLEDALRNAERELAKKGKRFLQTGVPKIILERNQDHLKEITDKILAIVAPDYVASSYNHLMQHYAVKDGRINQYVNLDLTSPVVEIYARMKHPCSLAEKAGRNGSRFGRISESYNKTRFMVGDILGMEIVVGDESGISYARKKILGMPCFTIEHEQDHAKSNGYRAKHLNLLYANGNPLTRWLEVEVQITTADNHRQSKEDATQSHDVAYANEKLAKPRTLLGHQLVIVGNSVKVDRDKMNVLDTEEFMIVPKVPNIVQKYTLVVPRHYHA